MKEPPKCELCQYNKKPKEVIIENEKRLVFADPDSKGEATHKAHFKDEKGKEHHLLICLMHNKDIEKQTGDFNAISELFGEVTKIEPLPKEIVLLEEEIETKEVEANE